MPKIQILNKKVLNNNKVVLQKVKRTYEDGYEDIDTEIILPHVIDEELLRRYERIKPIVFYNQLYHYLKNFDVKEMRETSYIWGLENTIERPVDISNAITVGHFSCYHTFGYVGFFKPSIAEILEQFPDDLLEIANAFYMVSSPKNSFDLSQQSEFIDAGCHRSVVKALVLKK